MAESDIDEQEESIFSEAALEASSSQPPCPATPPSLPAGNAATVTGK